jgi:hypothetical protein
LRDWPPCWCVLTLGLRLDRWLYGKAGVKDDDRT